MSDAAGRKDDETKCRLDLLPMDALWAIGDILTYGAQKYDAHNWEKGMDWHRPFGATLRHLFAFWCGEDMDKESGKPHLAHAACELLFLLTYYLRSVGRDDRWPTKDSGTSHIPTPAKT